MGRKKSPKHGKLVDAEECFERLPDDEDDCKTVAEARTTNEASDVPAMPASNCKNYSLAVNSLGKLMPCSQHVSNEIIVQTRDACQKTIVACLFFAYSKSKASKTRSQRSFGHIMEEVQ